MADGKRSELFQFLDRLSDEDEAKNRPRTWITATCPKCGREARRQSQPTPRGSVHWICLHCGVLDEPHN
jgi:transposase-like protein